jgi:hypothetical protein
MLDCCLITIFQNNLITIFVNKLICIFLNNLIIFLNNLIGIFFEILLRPVPIICLLQSSAEMFLPRILPYTKFSAFTCFIFCLLTHVESPILFTAPFLFRSVTVFTTYFFLPLNFSLTMPSKKPLLSNPSLFQDYSSFSFIPY